MFGTGVTLSVDQIWMILVLFAFLIGHLSGIVLTFRLGRTRGITSK